MIVFCLTEQFSAYALFPPSAVLCAVFARFRLLFSRPHILGVFRVLYPHERVFSLFSLSSSVPIYIYVLVHRACFLVFCLTGQFTAYARYFFVPYFSLAYAILVLFACAFFW